MVAGFVGISSLRIQLVANALKVPLVPSDNLLIQKHTRGFFLKTLCKIVRLRMRGSSQVIDRFGELTVIAESESMGIDVYVNVGLHARTLRAVSTRSEPAEHWQVKPVPMLISVKYRREDTNWWSSPNTSALVSRFWLKTFHQQTFGNHESQSRCAHFRDRRGPACRRASPRARLTE
jgi:hypothetical protein